MQSPSSYHICFLPRSQTGQVRRWVTLTQFPRSQSSHPNFHIFKTFGHSQTLRSTFRFRIVSLQPLDGFLPHCTHTTLRVIDVPFGGHDGWPISWPTISAKITLPSTFHFWTLQPLELLMDSFHIAHIQPLGVMCLLGSWPLTYFMTYEYDISQNNFAVNISFPDFISATPWWISSTLHTMEGHIHIILCGANLWIE